jgi:hypothetical protein
VTVLKKRFQTDKEWSHALLANGDSYLASDFSSDGNREQTNSMRETNPVDMISLTLGLLFHLTGEHKYADTLHVALRSFGQHKTWSSPALLTRNPPWHSELGTARLSCGPIRIFCASCTYS